jgi:hypothetical protein
MKKAFLLLGHLALVLTSSFLILGICVLTLPRIPGVITWGIGTFTVIILLAWNWRKRFAKKA